MIDVYSSATPNGYKVTVMLEEIGADYTLPGHESQWPHTGHRRPQ